MKSTAIHPIDECHEKVRITFNQVLTYRTAH